MEQFEYALESIVGLVIVPLVTQGIKKWLKIDIPAIKYLIVAVLAFGASYLLGQLYTVDLTVKDFALKGLMMASLAVFGKSLTKKK